MPDQDNIFGNQNPATQPNQTTPPAGTSGGSQPDTTLTDLLNTIKNERGEPKYKTTADALVALQNSQEYIPTLKSSLAEKEAKLVEAQEKLARMAELEETVRQLTQKKDDPPSTTQNQTETVDIAKLVDERIKQTQISEKRNQNLGTVVNAVKQQFGDKADEVFYAKAAELGFTKEAINTLAADNPVAALRLIGVDSKPANIRSPSTSVNTTGFQPRQESFVKRNTESSLFGTTTQELIDEHRRSNQMVDELHEQGLSVSDLSDPKVYFKVFKK